MNNRLSETLFRTWWRACRGSLVLVFSFGLVTTGEADALPEINEIVVVSVPDSGFSSAQRNGFKQAMPDSACSEAVSSGAHSHPSNCVPRSMHGRQTSAGPVLETVHPVSASGPCGIAVFSAGTVTSQQSDSGPTIVCH